MSDNRPHEPDKVDRPDQSESPDKPGKTISPSPHEIGSAATGGVVVDGIEHKFVGMFGACSACGRYVEECLDHRFCDQRLGFDDPRQSAGVRRGGREGRSFPHSYGGEGFNHVE